MRRIVFIAVCLVAADGPEPAFDGKSLTGWDHLAGHWTAANGIILGRSDGSLKTNTFLCSQKKYKDFEMSFLVRLKDGQGNSGVQIRSEILDKTKWLASNVENLRHEPISTELPGLSKYAVGEWRIFYSIDRDEHLLDVHMIVNQKELRAGKEDR